MAEQEGAARHRGRRHHLEVVLGPEVPDLELAAADDRQRRRLDAADADGPPRAGRDQGLGRRPGQGEVEDLVRLPAGHGGGVEVPVVGVRPQARERLAQGRRVLGGEDRPQHLAPEPEVLEDLLADELALAVAVGRDDGARGALQRLPDGLELGGLVAAAVGPGRVETLGLEQGEGPPPPRRVDLLGLGQPQQVPLGRQDLAVAVAERGPDVARLAALLGDDHGPHRRGEPLCSAGSLSRREQIRSTLPAACRGRIGRTVGIARRPGPRRARAGPPPPRR